MAGESTALKQSDDFLKTAYLKALFPVMVSILSGNINILVDGIIVGQKLGVDGLAALNLCLPVYLTLCVVGSFIVSGCGIATANAMGRNDLQLVQRFYHLSIGLCLISSVVITATGILCLDGITSVLCRKDVLWEMVRIYSGVTLLGAAPKILLYVPFWYLRVDGRNREVSVIMSVMAGTNIILDYVFIFIFDMGLFGAALASVIAATLATALGFAFLCDGKSGFRFSIRFRLKKNEWLLIGKNGSPAALNNLMQTLRIFAINYILVLYGNHLYIAMFAPINCISEFSLCLIQEVPQAASPMLGIYYGEKDNSSARILMKLQWKYGRLYTVFFGIIVTAAAGLIAMLYGLEVSLYLPMFWLSLSIFPALLSGIFSGYYNVSEHTGWANIIVFFRVFLFPVTAFVLLYAFELEPWSFTLLGELTALLCWLLFLQIYRKGRQDLSRFLLMDDRLERERKVLDFSVEASVEAVCHACEKISGFSEENGMSMKQAMRLSLSMEELMTMILKENDGKEIAFDLRLFTIQGTNGIRIRYSGLEYNPFSNKKTLEEDEYMGVRMIYDLAESVTYQRIFGMNMLQILI